MDELRQEILTIKKSVDKMYDALLGSSITKDGGLVGRIKHIEAQQQLMKTQIEDVKKGYAKVEVYQKIMWSSLGAIAMGVFAYVIQIWFSSK